MTSLSLHAFLLVAFGGALGASLRYITTVYITRWLGSGFPFGTLIVNIVGSFFMGVLITILARYVDGGSQLRLLLAVGFLGSYTTFSAFSLEIFTLLERNETLAATVYIAISLTGTLSATLLGMWITKALGTE